MPLYIAKSGDLDRCYRCLTHSLTTLKDRATQLLIKYKSGALVTQFNVPKSSRIQGFARFTVEQMKAFQSSCVEASSPLCFWKFCHGRGSADVIQLIKLE